MGYFDLVHSIVVRLTDSGDICYHGSSQGVGEANLKQL